MIFYNMKTKVFTVCSGYDSQCMGLDMLKQKHPDFDYELVGWSEIDKHAIQMHNLFYPQWADRNYGDLAKIDWEKVPDFDLFTYSTPCFVEGTMVLTSNGYKPIEDVEPGDKVLTHTNEYKMVTDTMQHPTNDLVKIKAMMLDELVCTGNHPFYARKKVRKGHLGQRQFCPAEWIEAKSLSKDYYLGYAINTDSKLPQWNGVRDGRWGHDNIANNISKMIESPSFWYIMGRYVGDGWRRTSRYGSGVVIACSDRNKQSLIDALDMLDVHYNITNSRTCYKVCIYSNEWHLFVQRYGYKAYGKRVDAETMALPPHLLEHFISGVVDSDGCKINNLVKVSSVSKELIYGLAQCVAKVYHRPSSIYKTIKEKTTTIEGRTVNQRDYYTIVWKCCNDKQDKAFYEDGHIWFPINSVQPLDEPRIVYNMEVEDDHTYTANGAIVHNCQDISTAGLQRGIEEGSGTRSSLLWECKKAITIKRPKYLLMENVKALVGKKFKPYFDLWLDFLSSQGYTNRYDVMDACDYDIPQHRERVFCVSMLDASKPYTPPAKRKLEKVLRDMLDDNVPPSYYLEPEKVMKFIEINEKKLSEAMASDSPQPASTESVNACEGGGDGSYSDPKWIKIEED